MNRLAVSGVVKSFGGTPVLRGVDLDVPAGSFTAILGPSGSGKTTLLRIIAGFERVDGGRVSVGDRLLDDGHRFVAPDERGIGYVSQEGSLFPHLNVEKNIAFGLPRAERKSAKVGQIMEMVGLAGLGRRFPHQLSGGQQQRVALARALAVEPQVVLLDEPFAGLDAALRASVRHDVRRILAEAGTTTVLVTHDQDEALSLADLVAVMGEGRIRQADRPQVLYEHPADPELARFVGDANLLVGTMEDGAVRTALGRHALAPGSPGGGPGTALVVLVRPEQVELVADPAEHLCAGRVADVEFYGHDTVVRVVPETDCGAPMVVARSAGGRVLAAGTRVGMVLRGPVLAWPAPAGGVGQPGADRAKITSP